MAKLSEFAPSLETARVWISDLMATLQADESRASKAFRAVTHELRDRLTVEEAAHLAAQMPLLLRGVFYEGWRPSRERENRRSKEKFLEDVAASFKEISQSEEIEEIVRDVFYFLERKISAGEIQDVVHSLPKELRTLWPKHVAERFSA